jgi:hypothetical protein
MNRTVRVLSELVCTAAALGLLVFAALADAGFYERHVAPSFCVDRPLAGWLVVRGLAAVLAILLVTLIRPRLARVIGRTTGRELAITTAGSVLALIAALVVGEVLLRRARWDDDLSGSNVAELEPDARLGWRTVPNRHTTLGPPARPFTYDIDAHGDRIRSPDEPEAIGPNLLVVAGESVAFGHNLAWDDTFSARAGRDLGLSVVNLGVAAYGSDQTYLHLLDALPRLSHPTLVVIVFVPIEIRRNVSPTRPRLELADDGQLVPVPAASGISALRLGRLFWDEPYHDRHALDVTRAILVATDRAVRASGAQPLFLLTNYGPPCRDPAPAMQKELFAGLPLVRVDLTLADTIASDDPHPNALGSKKLADAIVSFARRP